MPGRQILGKTEIGSRLVYASLVYMAEETQDWGSFLFGWKKKRHGTTRSRAIDVLLIHT